jgi:hypothetical protein
MLDSPLVVQAAKEYLTRFEVERQPTDTFARCEVRVNLIVCMARHPTANVVTDVGASLLGGWGNLIGFHYHEKDNAIELEFD